MSTRLIILLFLPAIVSSSLLSQDYEKANALYEAEQYVQAATEYEKVIPWLKIELGANDTTGLPTYYYLLGSSYYFSGQTEKAIEIHTLNHQFCIENFKGSSEMGINSLLQMCDIAILQHDNDRLIKYRSAIVANRMKSKENPENLLQLGYAYNDLGLANYNASLDVDAIENYKNAISILEKLSSTNSIDVANVQANLSSSYVYNHEYEKATKTYQSAFKTIYESSPSEYVYNIRTMKSLSQELISQKLYEEAKHALFIDIATKSKFIDNKDTSLIEAYIDLGNAYYYLNESHNGNLALDSAAHVISQNYQAQTEDWAFWHSYLAGRYDMFQNVDQAIVSAKNAFNYYKNNLSDFLYGYQITNNTLITFYSKKQDYKNALKHSNIKLQYHEQSAEDVENFKYYIAAIQENAEILSYLHKNEDAIEIIQKNLFPTEKQLGKGIVYVNLLDLLGNIYLANSNFDQAINVTEERLEILKKLNSENSADYGVAQNDLGNIYFKQGEFIKALEPFIQATDNFTDDIYLNKANNLNNIALCYIELANFKKAIEYFSKAKKIHKNHDVNNVHYCSIIINEARAHYESGNTAEAEKLYNEAKEITLSTEGKISESYITIQNSLGNLYLNSGRFTESAEAYVESVEHLEKVYSKNDPVILDLLGNYGHALCVLQNFDLGIEMLEKIRERLILNNGKENPKSMLNALNLGFAYHSNNQDDKARDMVNDQFETINNNVNYSLKYLGEGESINYLKRMNLYYSLCYTYLMDKGKDHPELINKGLNSLLQIKGKLLQSNTALKNQILNSKNPKLIETYQTWLQKLKSISSIQLMSNLDLDLLDKTIKEAEQLEKLLIEGSKDFAKSISQKYDWKDIQKTLKENEVVVEFVEYRHQEKFLSDTASYGAFIFDKNSSHPKFIPVCEVQQIVDVIGKYGGNNLSYIQGIYGKKGEKSKLYDLLWKPILEEIPTAQKVIIAPDGLLNKISFSGISDGSNFMNEKYQIQLVNASTTLLNKDVVLTELNPIIIGGVDYDFNVDKDAEHIWTYLAGTKTESIEIQNQFKTKKINVTALTGSEANEDALTRILPTKNIAHIATHGFFYPKPSLAEEITAADVVTDEDVVFRGGTRGMGYNFYVSNQDPMMRSGIALSGANQVWNKTDIKLEDDGVLTAQDIAVMDLRKLDLMVLSACETGLGDIEGSEGVYGLQRSLKMAGVKHIIMSLWQVPDNETKEFMIKFYNYLLDSKDIKDSFRKSQLYMSEKYDAFYWAAFVLI